MIDQKDAEVLIEIRGIYDGWSVAKMPNGELVNRWPVDDRRHKATQEWIDKEMQEAIGAVAMTPHFLRN